MTTLRNTIQITFPDGRSEHFARGATALAIAQHVSEGLARQVLAAHVNGEVWDATRAILQDSTVKLLTWDDVEGRQTFWHSSAHLMAEALEVLYPGIKLGIGPAIEHGFYYDIDFGEHTFDGTQLKAVEEKMLALAQQKQVYERIAISKAAAVQYFQDKNDPYKLELLTGLADGDITFYKQGNFTDLCKGPHIPHTGFIKAIELTNVAGAYWRGDEKNKQLTRIYGITFPKQKALKAYLALQEEAQKRNHQKLGKELGLFTFSQKVGIGLPLWLPKGARLRERLEQFLRRAQTKAGYQPVITPHIGHKALYITSGHYEKYGQDSFQPINTPHEGEEFLLKPMNCPHHCEIYKSIPRSYKDLPLRLAEFGTVYRYEQHGELHGLARTRGFTQDDAHIFCRPDQVREELEKVIDLVLYVFKALGFSEYTAQVSLRDTEAPGKYIGQEKAWMQAEQAIKEVVTSKGFHTTQIAGEAAFYGPKLDFMVKDALGRSWQLGTVQLDYQLPERFALEYVGADNKKHRPVIIHRAPFGSLERFIAILIEHTAGEFPLWLAPEQVVVLAISDKYAEYAQQVHQTLVAHDIHSVIDHRVEKIGRKIRDAELRKIPYMLIVGEREMSENVVAVRQHRGGDQGRQNLSDFVAMITTAVAPAFA
ncbi:MAG: threonine--tRNA ligase [Bacteroidota bacterium]